MGILDKFKKTNKKGDLKNMNKEELTQEAEFTEVEEKVEEVNQEETPKTETSVEKGVLVFQDEDNVLRYQLIGEVSLENITYYLRYLEELEKKLWIDQMAGENNA